MGGKGGKRKGRKGEGRRRGEGRREGEPEASERGNARFDSSDRRWEATFRP
jgi:hypothetical protein